MPFSSSTGSRFYYASTAQSAIQVDNAISQNQSITPIGIMDILESCIADRIIDEIDEQCSNTIPIDLTEELLETDWTVPSRFVNYNEQATFAETMPVNLQRALRGSDFIKLIEEYCFLHHVNFQMTNSRREGASITFKVGETTMVLKSL